MNIKINTEFSNELENEEYQINIKTSEISKNLPSIISSIQSIENKYISIITAEKDNKIYLFETYKIQKFFSKGQNVYCMCNNTPYKVKKKLYELEDVLDNRIFIRISNSCIINIKQIECFDTGIVGNIVVKFKDNSIENVSKRRISEVTKFLKERWNCYD